MDETLEQALAYRPFPSDSSRKIYYSPCVFVVTIMRTLVFPTTKTMSQRHIYLVIPSVCYVVSIGSKPSVSIFAMAAASA
jgi:hypothetical protein